MDYFTLFAGLAASRRARRSLQLHTEEEARVETEEAVGVKANSAKTRGRAANSGTIQVTEPPPEEDPLPMQPTLPMLSQLESLFDLYRDFKLERIRPPDLYVQDPVACASDALRISQVSIPMTTATDTAFHQVLPYFASNHSGLYVD